MIKKTLAVVAVLGFVVVAVYVATPRFLEVMIDRDCSQPNPGESCLTRMRALGHVWSKRGRLVRAKLWYGRAAEHGNAAAMFHLAWVHEELALRGTEKDLWQEADRMAASQFARDRNTAPPPAAAPDDRIVEYLELAMAWYRRSAEGGFAPGMNNLGQMYLSGWGGRQDHDAAFRWHLAAARAGNPVGRMNVAIAYSAGHGVTPDPLETAKWSTWMPNDGRAAELLEPTLARTRLFGTSLPEHERERLRASAKVGAEVTMIQRPLAADPSLPTFQEAEEALPNRRP